MKRQAEHQISKDDDGPDTDMDEENPKMGLHKASEEVLARRPMKGLPQRGAARTPQASPSTASSTTSTPTISPFGVSSSATPSVFSTAAPAASSNTSFSGFSGFGPSSGTINSSSSTTNIFSIPSSIGSPFSFQPSSAPVPPTATNTSKAFASLLSNPFATPASNSHAPGPTPTSNIPSPGKNHNDSATLNYYTNLRGLNMSMMTAVSKRIEEDPFVDISEILEKYQSFRLQIQRDLDASTTSNGDQNGAPILPPPASSTNKPSMPTPPTTFTGFGNVKSSMSNSPTPSISAVSPIPAPSSTFSGFGNVKSSSSMGSSASGSATLPSAPANVFSSKPTSGFGFSASDSKSSASTFGSSSAFGATAVNSTGTTSASSSPFTFGGLTNKSSSSSSASSSPFSFGSSSPLSNTLTSGSNPFGSSAITSFPFKTADKSADAPAASSKSSPFGITDKTSSTTSVFAPVSDAKLPNTGAIHFGFGVSSTSGSGAPATSTEETTTEGESSERGTPAIEGDEASTPGASIIMGEGEEDEDTVYESRVKAYIYTKPDDKDVGKWVSLGTGELKLKREKPTTEGENASPVHRRMLMRHDANVNSKILINSKIYSAMKVTQGANGKSLSFVGHKDGVAQTYNISFSSTEEATKFKTALEEQIAVVTSK